MSGHITYENQKIKIKVLTVADAVLHHYNYKIIIVLHRRKRIICINGVIQLQLQVWNIMSVNNIRMFVFLGELFLYTLRVEILRDTLTAFKNQETTYLN